MQDTMVYEQEQLLFAIDDIDDATIMAESAVINQLANLWLKTSMIQESMTPEQFEKYYQEANAAERLGGKLDDFTAKVKDKIKNFSFKDMFVKIWEAIKRVWSVIWNKTMKFISHFKPSYIADLVRTNNTALAHVAKKHGCKVRVETDGKLTLLLPFIDLTYFEKWIKRNTSGVDRMIKDLKRAADGGKNITKIRELNYFDMWSFRDKAAKDQFLADQTAGKFGEKESRTDEQRVTRNMAILKSYPTKLMSLDEFTSYAESGTSEHLLSGKPKKFQNLSQYMSEFKKKVDELVSLARSFKDNLDDKADENLKQFAQSLIDTSTKFQTSVTEAQNAMTNAISTAKTLAEAVKKDLLHYSGKKEMDEYIAKRAKSKNPETEAKQTEELQNRNQEVINKIG